MSKAISNETLDQIILTRLNLDAHESLAAKATEIPFSNGEYADYDRTERVAWAKANRSLQQAVIQAPVKLADWDTPVFNQLVDEMKWSASNAEQGEAIRMKFRGVVCPKCKAQPGESCFTSSGKPTLMFHVQRKQLANGIIEYDPES